MVFDVSPDNNRQVYHLCEGNWYRVEQDYIAKIKEYLDDCFEDTDLIAYNHGTEGAYNQAVQKNNNRYICSAIPSFKAESRHPKASHQF